jgi:hypothetical protein
MLDWRKVDTLYVYRVVVAAAPSYRRLLPTEAKTGEKLLPLVLSSPNGVASPQESRPLFAPDWASLPPSLADTVDEGSLREVRL